MKAQKHLRSKTHKVCGKLLFFVKRKKKSNLECAVLYRAAGISESIGGGAEL